MPANVKDMLAAANAAVPRITPDAARKMIADGNALVVDVRDPAEVAASGKVKGAINIPRGMLEFRADPDTAYFDKSFSKDRPVIVYCASGGRSALSGQTLKVICTDAGSVRDFQAFAKQTGNVLVQQETVGGEHISLLKRR